MLIFSSRGVSVTHPCIVVPKMTKTRICSNIDMAELARTHQKSSVLRADTANLRIEEVVRVDLYPT